MKKEPAVLIAAIMAIVQGIWIFVSGNTEVSLDWLMPVLTLAVGFITRSKVMPVETIRDAGMTPAEVNELAADPNVPRPDERAVPMKDTDVRSSVVSLIARAVGKLL